ncbi:ATP-binding protein [Streptomyces sp. NPDC059627]
MSVADRERAFDRFWSASGSHHDGTGLGLPIVRHLVDASGGTIALNPAPGTSLDVALLLHPVTRQRSHGARTPRSAPASARTR